MTEATINLMLSLIVINTIHFVCLQPSAMTEAAINLMLSLIVINTIHFVRLQTSAMAEAAINLILLSIVLNAIDVCVFTDISHGRGHHQSDVIINCN